MGTKSSIRAGMGPRSDDNGRPGRTTMGITTHVRAAKGYGADPNC